MNSENQFNEIFWKNANEFCGSAMVDGQIDGIVIIDTSHSGVGCMYYDYEGYR